jgi:hypothetical protein
MMVVYAHAISYLDLLPEGMCWVDWSYEIVRWAEAHNLLRNTDYGVTVGRHPVLNKPAKLIWFQDSQSMLLFKLNFR